MKEQQLRSSAGAQGEEGRKVGDGREIAKAGTETVHLCLESGVSPSAPRTTASTRGCGVRDASALVQEGDLAHRWPVLSFGSHKQTFELSIYKTV